VKVAAVQFSSDMGTIQKNTEKAVKLCKEAAQNGAKFIVLPEAAITGYLSQDLQYNWHLEEWPINRLFKSKDPVSYFVVIITYHLSLLTLYKFQAKLQTHLPNWLQSCKLILPFPL
jgi:predicted amidohydrolase